MKQLQFLLGGILLILMATSCNKAPDNPNNGEGIKTMDGLAISDNFDWRTTKTVNVNIILPDADFSKVVSIYSNDLEELYYTGFATNNNLLSTKLTLPTSVQSAVLVYGLEEDFEPITVYVEDKIEADLNNLKTTLKDSRGVDCGCSGGIFSLTMRYDGPGTPNIKVREKKKNVRIYCGTVVSGEAFTIIGGSKKDGRFDNTIRFYVDEVLNTTMHVSCSQPLEVGDQFGDFTIISGISKNNVPLCGTPPSPPPPPPPADPPTTTTVNFDGCLAYEDLWPGKGDYDFNDLVVDYKFNVTKDDDDRVLSMTGVFTVHSFGATFYNGFGFTLPGISPDKIISVSGYEIQPGSIYSLAANGLEDNQSEATVIVFDDSYNILTHPGVGIGVNTETSAPYVPIDSVIVQMVFFDNGVFAPGGSISFDELNIGEFNPFIIVNQDRDVEVHLRDFIPSDLITTSLFGTLDDNSIPGQSRYYTTVNNLPWAINIPIVLAYPIEKQDIVGVHLKFAEWAESEGTLSTDWYEDLPGYRNETLIYPVPQ